MLEHISLLVERVDAAPLAAGGGGLRERRLLVGRAEPLAVDPNPRSPPSFLPQDGSLECSVGWG